MSNERDKALFETATHIRDLEVRIAELGEQMKALRKEREESISALVDVSLDCQGVLPMSDGDSAKPSPANKCSRCGRAAKKWANDELCAECYEKE